MWCHRVRVSMSNVVSDCGPKCGVRFEVDHGLAIAHWFVTPSLKTIAGFFGDKDKYGSLAGTDSTD